MRTANLCVAAAVVGATMCGCVTSDDPKQGGFVSGVASLSTGAYEKRLDEKRDALDEAKAEQADLERELANTRAERERVAGERTAAETRLAAIEGSLSEMSRQLAAAEHGQAIDASELSRLRGELGELERAHALTAANPGLDATAKLKRISELEQRKQRLEQTLTEALAE